MLLHKLRNNKKIIIVVAALLLALCLGIVLLVTSNMKETGNKNTDTETQQDKEDADTTDDADKTDTDDKAEDKVNSTDNNGHQVLKPNEVAVDDSSDASGEWGEEEESKPQKDMMGDKAPEDEPVEDEPQEDIKEDNISWGEIY